MIEVTRERSMAGEERLYWSIFRESDEYECDSGHSDPTGSVRARVKELKARVDAELAENDPWLEKEGDVPSIPIPGTPDSHTDLRLPGRLPDPPATPCRVEMKHSDTGQPVGPCAETASFIEDGRWHCRRGHPLPEGGPVMDLSSRIEPTTRCARCGAGCAEEHPRHYYGPTGTKLLCPAHKRK